MPDGICPSSKSRESIADSAKTLALRRVNRTVASFMDKYLSTRRSRKCRDSHPSQVRGGAERADGGALGSGPNR